MGRLRHRTHRELKLLLHMDGSNGSTTFTDSSPVRHTVTPTVADITTSHSVFGGAGGSFITSRKLTMASTEFNLAGDFNIEFWYKAGSSVANQGIFQTDTTYDVSGEHGLMIFSTSTNLTLYASSAHSSWDIANAVDMGTYSTSQFNHYAVTKQGSAWKTWKNGTQVSTFTNAAAPAAPTGNTLIGVYDQHGNNTVTYYMNGYLDEFLVYNGLAKTAFPTRRYAYVN